MTTPPDSGPHDGEGTCHGCANTSSTLNRWNLCRSCAANPDAQTQPEEQIRAAVVYAQSAAYRDGNITLVGDVSGDGVRIGLRAAEPWYGAGVLIPPGHPAYRAAQAFLAALCDPPQTHQEGEPPN